MPHVDFIVVRRVDFDDIMAIPITVQKQYPHKFIPIEEEKEKVEEPKPRKTRKTNK